MVNSLANSIVGMVFFAVSSRGDIVDQIQRMVEGGVNCPSDHLASEINAMMDNLSDDLSDFEGFSQASEALQLIPIGLRKKFPSSHRVWSQYSDHFNLNSPMICSVGKEGRVPGDKSNMARLATASSPAYKLIIDYIRSREQKLVDVRKMEWIEASRVLPNGITILHDPPVCIADVVLIPGLSGDPWNTWSCTPRCTTRPASLGKFWPQTYLPSRLSDTRIVTWGVEFDVRRQRTSLISKAPLLLRELSRSRPMGRSLIFVTQDEGAFLLKETLRLSEEGQSKKNKDIISCTTAIVFLSSRRGVGQRDILLDHEEKQTSQGSQRYTTGGPSTDAALTWDLDSFQVLQETYRIHVTCLLEAAPQLDFTESSHPIRLKHIEPTKAQKALVERISTSAQGFCRFESAMDPGYARLSGILRSDVDDVKRMGLPLREECLRSLCFDQLHDRKDAVTRAAFNTATWLLDNKSFANWRSWSAGPNRRDLLWVKGKPGSGKSTLMKRTLEHLETAGLPASTSIASFFFTARSNVKLQKSVLGLFRTLLYSLLEQDRALLSAFIPLYQEKQAAESGRWKWNQAELQGFFKSAYSTKYPYVKKAVVLIDALDESSSGSSEEAFMVARDLVHFFRNTAAAGKLKVCLSSRHYPNIEVPDCDQIVMENFNENDITKFVHEKLFDATQPDITHMLKIKITKKANGVFIWASLVVGNIRSGLDNHMTKSDLEQLLEDLPSELEKLFEDMLETKMDREHLKKAEQIFQWVLLAQRPMAMPELRHVLTINRARVAEATTTIPIKHWSKSDDCLSDVPETFLKQLALYTRGLVEIVLRRPYSNDLEVWETPDIMLLGIAGAADTPVVSETVRFSESFGVPEKVEARDYVSSSHNLELIASEIPENFEILKSSKNVVFSDFAVSEIFNTPKYLQTLLRRPLLKSQSHSEGLEKTRQFSRRSSNLSIADAECGCEFGFHDLQMVSRYPVQFIHETVREFFVRGTGFALLRSNDRQKTLSERHKVLAEYCMASILQSGLTMHEFSDENKLPDLPFLSYACFGIFYHAEQAEHGHIIAEKVLQQLIDPEQIFWKLWLLVATWKNDPEVENFQRSGVTPIHLLIRYDMFRSISYILSLGFEIDAPDRCGNSALHHAASKSDMDLVKFLVDNQASVELQNLKGETPCHLALNSMSSKDRSLNQHLLDLLIVNRGSCSNLRDSQGQSLLHIAAKHGNFIAMGVLLAYFGPEDVDNLDVSNQSALHLAVENQAVVVVEMLLSSGAGINIENGKGESTVQIASRIGNASILHLLIQRDRGIDAKNKSGMTTFKHGIADDLGTGSLIQACGEMKDQDSARISRESKIRERRRRGGRSKIPVAIKKNC